MSNTPNPVVAMKSYREILVPSCKLQLDATFDAVAPTRLLDLRRALQAAYPETEAEIVLPSRWRPKKWQLEWFNFGYPWGPWSQLSVADINQTLGQLGPDYVEAIRPVEDEHFQHLIFCRYPVSIMDCHLLMKVPGVRHVVGGKGINGRTVLQVLLSGPEGNEDNLKATYATLREGLLLKF